MKREIGQCQKNNNFLLRNSDVNLIFPIYGWSGATEKPNYGCIVHDF